MNALDRLIGAVAPALALKRVRARLELGIVARHYEGAAIGRRTAGWTRSSGDANAASRAFLASLRDTARDLVRNNAHAASALDTIADHVVGWEIKAKPKRPDKAAEAIWAEWAGTTACDADGRHDMGGLQKLVQRTVVESGECLVRPRTRRPGDVDASGRELPLPLQLQVLEPDYLDSEKNEPSLPNGGTIVAGVEFDSIGRRVAYWLFGQHPGTEWGTNAFPSRRIPAEGVLHVFRQTRPGQVRGVSWFGPVILKMKDWDEYDDAQLMKQKIAALLAGIVTDTQGGGNIVGTLEPGAEFPSLYPGALVQAPVGTDVKFTDPPTTSEYRDYAQVTLRTIAAGLGLNYEDLTGDYTDLPFSAARMSRLRHWARVEDWRWQTLIPQFCDPVWFWAMRAAAVMGRVKGEPPAATWTAPPPPMLDPTAEGTAYKNLVRIGARTWPEMVRELGYDPQEVLSEIKAWNAKLDEAGVVLDSDPRKTSQQGQEQPSEAAPVPPPAAPPAGRPAPAGKPAA